MKCIFLLLLSTSFVYADCGVAYPEGMKKKLASYESFVSSLSKSKQPIKEINKHIQEKGILLDVYLSKDGLKAFSESIQSDSIADSRSLFLKRLVGDKKGLTLDDINEITSPGADKVLTKWPLPANYSISGVLGDEVLVRTSLQTPCSQNHFAILLAINPKGKMRVINETKLPEIKTGLDCPAVKKIYKTSDYRGCQEVIDLKSKKKRYFLFQYPMT